MFKFAATVTVGLTLALGGAACGSGAPKAASPTTTCAYPVGQGADVIERFVVPGQQATAELLGAHALCGFVAASPSGPGYCTQIAWAAANPGYNPEATPARPLKGVLKSAGAAC